MRQLHVSTALATGAKEYFLAKFKKPTKNGTEWLKEECCSVLS
jgi:hypothetical protein